MESNDVPDSEDTAGQVNPLHILIVQALEYGELSAREAFAIWKRKIERNLFNNLVRFHAVNFLREQEQAFITYAQEKVNNNGIGVIFEGFHCKVLKASNERIPGSNLSQSRRLFLSQFIQPSLFTGMDAFEDAVRTVKTNLVFLWDHDAQYRIDRLWLVMPKGVSRRQVLAYWQVLLPNPILSVESATSAQVEDAFEDTLEDEIQLPDMEEQNEGQDETGQAQ